MVATAQRPPGLRCGQSTVKVLHCRPGASGNVSVVVLVQRASNSIGCWIDMC